MIENGKILNISHTENVEIASSNMYVKNLILQNILHVPSIVKNLLSVSQFVRDNRAFFEFHHTHYCKKDKKEKNVLLKGTIHNGFYVFNLNLFSK